MRQSGLSTTGWHFPNTGDIEEMLLCQSDRAHLIIFFRERLFNEVRHCVKTVFRENFDSAFEHLGKVDGKVVAIFA